MSDSRRTDDTTLRAVQGDITGMRVDAVVNAANERLAHGGGVAAALARAGGEQVQRESDEWVRTHGPVRPGQAVVTTAGRMPAGMIVHVVGPRYRTGQDNEGLLAQAVRAALDAAADAGATSIALPAISAGIFGYPLEEATRLIARTCASWLADGSSALRDIALVGFDQRTTDQFAAGIAASHDDLDA